MRLLLCVRQAWQLSGDAYATHPGDKPWISEMYGYSFGAAKADVWHKYHTTAMIYPGYLPIGALQAGLFFHVCLKANRLVMQASAAATAVTAFVRTLLTAQASGQWFYMQPARGGQCWSCLCLDSLVAGLTCPASSDPLQRRRRSCTTGCCGRSTTRTKYSFDKHWHYEFQATRCPPWDLEGEHTDAKGGLFPHPPRASSFNTSVQIHTTAISCR